MSEFTDVSQYLNRSGQASLLQNIQVQSGIFSATSTGDKDAQFFPLFPGYETAMLIGKVGELFPIDRSVYRCVYIAMRVESGPADGGGPDQFQVFWFADELLVVNAWGFTSGLQLYPEAGGGQPTHSWRLYQADLVANHGGGSTWNSQSAWRGLRIDPTLQSGVDFEVDWVRLTGCSANNETITWSGGSQHVWLESEEGGHQIRITDSAISSGQSIDTQGIAPGTYTVRLGGQTACCGGPTPSPLTLLVNQTPIANFVRPSPSSGEDYATLAGNSWNFTDGSDVTSFVNVSAGFSNGLINLQTNSAPLPDGADPQIHLNSPQQIAAASAYRYLNFRLSTTGSIQNVPWGMIARWIWTIPGSGGGECHLVSQDMPFDVNWQTYWIDLSDIFNGSVEQNNGNCAGAPNSWSATNSILRLRFDPNENALGTVLSQQLDWIKLSKVDRVSSGVPYMFQILLNKPPEDIQSFSYFYTLDPQSDPGTWTAAPEYTPSPPPTPTGANIVFLPVILRGFQGLGEGVTFQWDTTSVSPGEYYICVTLDDGLNQASFCSDAPVKVE
ncbi:MAG: hypothetical protein ACC700_16000 [Anaerolineales bacterium]